MWNSERKLTGHLRDYICDEAPVSTTLASRWRPTQTWPFALLPLQNKIVCRDLPLELISNSIHLFQDAFWLTTLIKQRSYISKMQRCEVFDLYPLLKDYLACILTLLYFTFILYIILCNQVAPMQFRLTKMEYFILGDFTTMDFIEFEEYINIQVYCAQICPNSLNFETLWFELNHISTFFNNSKYFPKYKLEYFSLS